MSGIGFWRSVFYRVTRPRLPQVGELWSIDVQNKADPFGAKEQFYVKVLDVKKNWVRYSMGSVFSDERMPIQTFLFVYSFYKEAGYDTEYSNQLPHGNTDQPRSLLN